jgi:UDP-2-acetamido-2,6-beta-L-arabino-hexul-4-ose reductase
MKVVVTGARGFIGRNVVVALRRARIDVAEIDRHSSPDAVAGAVTGAQSAFHLAGVNRPQNEGEFAAGNVGSLEALLEAIEESAESGGNDAAQGKPLVVLASSMQAALDNPYGRSKLAAEQVLDAYVTRTGSSAVIYRLPGVFGKWCRPDYNSVVATFCHNIARDLPIVVSDPGRVLELVHVDDVVARLMTHLQARAELGITRGEVSPVFTISVGELADRLRTFRAMRDTLLVTDASDPLTRRLLGTYTSYIPPGDLAYALTQRTDARGTLAELLKSSHFGQIFVSRTYPGITRGNHYHDLKVEKFCVLEGDAVIRFRSVLGDAVTEHRVSGIDFKVVDIPPGTTHSIENVGSAEMIVLFWASEILDPQRPDTHADEVLRG